MRGLPKYRRQPISCCHHSLAILPGVSSAVFGSVLPTRLAVRVLFYINKLAVTFDSFWRFIVRLP